MHTVSTSEGLPKDQVDLFWEQGFLSLGPLVTQEELEDISLEYDRLFEEKVGFANGDFFDLASNEKGHGDFVLPQLLNFRKYAPKLLDTQLIKNVDAIGKSLLGPTCDVVFDHAILKPAGYGAPTPWHQDQAYWQRNATHDGVSFWIPLQDVTQEQGCLQFIPQSHKKGVIPHKSIGNDPRIHGLETLDPVTETSAVCPLAAGEATVHHCRTLHYAEGNKGASPRRALIFICRTPPEFDASRPEEWPWQEAKNTARLARNKTAAS